MKKLFTLALVLITVSANAQKDTTIFIENTAIVIRSGEPVSINDREITGPEQKSIAACMIEAKAACLRLPACVLECTNNPGCEAGWLAKCVYDYFFD